MSFHLVSYGTAESDAGEIVSVPAREVIRYEGRGVTFDMDYGGGGSEAVLYEDNLDTLPQPLRAQVRASLDKAAALLFEGRYRWG